jgi:enoyl-CoA hydratase/carnithine racemase
MTTTTTVQASFIQTHTHACVAHIKIARIEKKNALSHAMYHDLVQAIDSAVGDASVRSILLYGEATVFTAGNDIEEFVSAPPIGENSSVFQFMRTFSHCPKPIVVAVNGPAVGIGTTLLLHADLVYAADNAWLSMPFVSLGLCAEFASSVLLPAMCGSAKASEKLLLGESMSAEEARDLGIVTQVLPPDNVLPHAIRKAEKFALLSPDAVQSTKRLMRAPKQAAIDAAIAQEAMQFERLLHSPQAKQAMMAFMQKRKPDFSQFA